MTEFVIHRCKNFNWDPVASRLNDIYQSINYKITVLRKINAFLQLTPNFEFERDLIFAKNYIKEDKPDKAFEIILNIKTSLGI